MISYRSKTREDSHPRRVAPDHAQSHYSAPGPYDGVLSLQRSAGNRAVADAVQSERVNTSLPPDIQDILHLPGQPLDPETRALMETRIGHDLSGVRVHTDSEAAASAKALNSKAYTIGADVIFAAGRYAPRTSEGRGLLGHELTHVTQQAIVSRADIRISRPGDAAELQANDVGDKVAQGQTVRISPVHPAATLHRELELPSAEAPGLGEITVAKANAHLARREWQEALDVIVDDLIRKGDIDRSLLEGGRMHFQAGTGGEGLTTPRGFRRTPASGLKTLRHPVRLDRLAFNRGVPWLYRTILHEYHHLLQLKDPRGLPTIESAVPGQAPDPVLIHQQEVETYASGILQAGRTGEAAKPRDIREDWRRTHWHWSQLGPSERKVVRDIYVRAHAAAEAILGPGTLNNYAPGPP